jgi:hypothetical protein
LLKFSKKFNLRLNLNNKTKNLKFWRGRENKNKFMKPLKEGKSDKKAKQAGKPLTEKNRLAKIESEDFDNFIERLDLQEWLERLEKEINQIKAKLKD